MRNEFTLPRAFSARVSITFPRLQRLRRGRRRKHLR